MRRRFVESVGISLILVSFGCNSLGGRPRFALPSFSRTENTPVSSPASTESESSESDDTNHGREPLIAENSMQSVHDSATQTLIDTELRDLPPGERTEWVTYLNSVDPKMVPYILKARRIKETGNEADSIPKKKLVAESPLELKKGSEDVQRVSGTEADLIKTTAATASEDSPIQSSNAESLELQAELESEAESNVAPSNTEDGSAVEDSTVQGLEAPNPAKDQSWPHRLKSLADPKRIWPTQDNSDLNKEKQSNPLSLLPKILGGGEHDSVKPKSSESGRAEPILFDLNAASEPKVAETGQLRIPRGSELWEDELDKLISLLEAETSSVLPGSAAVRGDVRKEVALRMLYLIGDQPQLAQQAIPGISHVEQEFWTALFLGLSEYLDEQSPAGPAERATSTIAQLRTAAHHLQEISYLQLKNVTFCQKINSFGNYVQFEVDEFSIGQPVLVYTEVRNFRSEPTMDGFYRTKLKSIVEIYQGGTNGKLVDRNVFAPTEDLCRTLRTDYYHSYRIDLPTHLTPGPHVLKLTVQDELSGKITTESIRFSVY